MKKHLYPLLLLALGSTALSAQGPAKADSRWSVSFSAGGAIPLGSFADIATMAGHTHTNSGLAAELAASYRICSSFDFALAAGEQLNSGDGIAYNPYNIGAPVTSIYQDQTWKITRLTGGGTVNLPLQRNGRLNFFIRQLAGVQKTKAADFYRSYHITQVIPGYTGFWYTFTYPGTSFPWTFAWETDAGISWKSKRNWGVRFYAGFSGSALKKDLPYLESDLITFTTRRTTIPTTNLHIGLAIVQYFRSSKK